MRKISALFASDRIRLKVERSVEDEKMKVLGKRSLRRVSREVADAYKNCYGDKLISVFLYGSYARGEADEESDIDYVAIVDLNRREARKILANVIDFTYDISLKNDVVISPTVIPLSNYKRFGEVEPYYKNINREGIQID